MKKLLVVSAIAAGFLGLAVANAGVPLLPVTPTVTVINKTAHKLTVNLDAVVANATTKTSHIDHEQVYAQNSIVMSLQSGAYVNVFNYDPDYEYADKAYDGVGGYFPACIAAPSANFTIVCEGSAGAVKCANSMDLPNTGMKDGSTNNCIPTIDS